MMHVFSVCPVHKLLSRLLTCYPHRHPILDEEPLVGIRSLSSVSPAILSGRRILTRESHRKIKRN